MVNRASKTVVYGSSALEITGQIVLIVCNIKILKRDESTSCGQRKYTRSSAAFGIGNRAHEHSIKRNLMLRQRDCSTDIVSGCDTRMIRTMIRPFNSSVNLAFQASPSRGPAFTLQRGIAPRVFFMPASMTILQ